MELNFVGVVAALSTFIGVWFGHVAVRKIESISRTIWLPTTAFAIAGIVTEWLALLTADFLISTALGIVGFTLLWDAIELTRQQNRVRNGHAPANANNPRHARLMGESSEVTTIDLLKRDPVGKPITPTEAIQLIAQNELPITNY
jgi:hypothetical protein